MTALLRYLVSLALHIAWARMGKGPIPAVKLPRRGPVNLPVIGPWQMMIGLWLVNRVWERFGHGVKSNLANHPHPAARAAGSLLPDVPGKPPVATAPPPAQAPTQAAPTASTPPAPVHPAPASPPPVKPVVAKPAPSFATRILSRGKNAASTEDDNPSNSNSSHLPAGSVLGGLRRSAGHNGGSNS